MTSRFLAFLLGALAALPASAAGIDSARPFTPPAPTAGFAPLAPIPSFAAFATLASALLLSPVPILPAATTPRQRTAAGTLREAGHSRISPSAEDSGKIQFDGATPAYSWVDHHSVTLSQSGGIFEMHPKRPLELGFHGDRVPSYFLHTIGSPGQPKKILLANKHGDEVAAIRPGETIVLENLRIHLPPEGKNTVLVANLATNKPMEVALKKDAEHITVEYERGWSRRKTIFRKIGVQENLVNDPGNSENKARLDVFLLTLRGRLALIQRQRGSPILPARIIAEHLLYLVQDYRRFDREKLGLDPKVLAHNLGLERKDHDVLLVDALCATAGGVCRHKIMAAAWLLDRLLQADDKIHITHEFGHVYIVIETTNAANIREFWVLDPAQQTSVFPLDDADKYFEDFEGTRRRYRLPPLGLKLSYVAARAYLQALADALSAGETEPLRSPTTGGRR